MKRTILLTVAVMFGAVGLVRADEPAKYAILIGVTKYEHDLDFPDLKYTENDVSELGQKLRAGGFQVKQLSEETAARNEKLKPNRQNILREIDAVLQVAKRDDMVLIAMSGHGMQPFGDTENFFCPFDARSEDTNTLIGMNNLYNRLGQCPSRSKMVLIDACRDDKASGKGITKVVAPPPGVFVLLSCAPNERSYEHDDLRHGVFYYFLLDGLNGKARNDDGEITFGLLADYVSRRVSRTVPTLVRNGAKQSPHLAVNGTGASPLLFKGEAAQPVVVANVRPAPVDNGNAIGNVLPAPVNDGHPTAREILGAWGWQGDSTYFHNDGSVVWASGVVYLKGVFTCGHGFIDVTFPDVNWDLRLAVSWTNDAKTEMNVRVVDTNVPFMFKIGMEYTVPRSPQPEPAAPPTRQELVGNWANGVVYSMNADHTFVVWYNGGHMTGTYGYCGNVLYVRYNETGCESLGLMSWADARKTTVRSTILATNVPGGGAPGSKHDFLRVK